MKKINCILCAAALMASIFCGCGGTAPSTASSVAANQQSTSEPESIQEMQQPESVDQPENIPVETETAEDPEEDSAYALPEETASITYPVGDGQTFSIALVADGDLTSFLPGSDPANCGAVRMMQDVTGINLDYTVFAMLSDNMTLMLASGDWTDVICKIQDTTGYTLQSALDEDIILDLAPYIEEYAPDYASAIHSNDLYEKTCYTDDGRLGEFSEFRVGTPIGAVIRKDWLTAAGIDKVPETYDEFEQACLAVKAQHPDIPSIIPMGGSLISECYENEFRYGYGFNDNFFKDENGQVQFAWTNDAARDYLEMLSRWVEEGIMNKEEMLTVDVMSLRSRIYVGDSFLQFNGAESYSDSFLSMVEDPDFELAPMYNMVRSKGDVLRVGASDSTPSAGWQISTTCEEPEVLMQAINWFYTDEGKIAMNFGVLDESYTIDGDGNYHFTDLVLNNPDGIPLFFAVSVYTGLDTPTVGMEEQQLAKLTSQEAIDAVQFWRSQPANNDAVLRGSLNSKEIEEASVFADINTVVQERVMEFVMGNAALTDGNWENFVDTINSMGIDKVIACYQSAEDRYDAR